MLDTNLPLMSFRDERLVFTKNEPYRVGEEHERGVVLKGNAFRRSVGTRRSTVDCRHGRCLNSGRRYLHVITWLTI